MAAITPEEQEQERLQQAADDQFVLAQQDAETIDAKQIENATPSDLKAMGIAKLPLLLLVIGNQVKNIIKPQNIRNRAFISHLPQMLQQHILIY